MIHGLKGKHFGWIRYILCYDYERFCVCTMFDRGTYAHFILVTAKSNDMETSVKWKWNSVYKWIIIRLNLYIYIYIIECISWAVSIYTFRNKLNGIEVKCETKRRKVIFDVIITMNSITASFVHRVQKFCVRTLTLSRIRAHYIRFNNF